MKSKRNLLEDGVHGIFLLLGLVTVGCVLMITVYLVVSGIPAIREIGLIDFLFGDTWASTAAEPKYGILPFILTSVYGTAGAILLGVPIGFLTAVYLAKMAPKSVKEIMGQAVSMLAFRLAPGRSIPIPSQSPPRNYCPGIWASCSTPVGLPTMF